MDRTCALRVKQMTLTSLGNSSFARHAFRFCFTRVSREKFAKIVTRRHTGGEGFRVDTLPIEEWTIPQNVLESQRS
jgi:hypothetical protein